MHPHFGIEILFIVTRFLVDFLDFLDSQDFCTKI